MSYFGSAKSYKCFQALQFVAPAGQIKPNQLPAFVESKLFKVCVLIELPLTSFGKFSTYELAMKQRQTKAAFICKAPLFAAKLESERVYNFSVALPTWHDNNRILARLRDQ